MSKPIAKSFQARLERADSRLGWVIIRVPFSVPKIWKARGLFKVKGEINGFAFRTSLFPRSGGGHIMLVNKRMQAAANAGLGTVAWFHLEPDTEERTVAVPRELKRAFAGDRTLGRWCDKLNYSMRKELSDWIGQVKSAAARVRRAEQIAERLLATMEAEVELPPMLRRAFAQDARAQRGWERMSASHRRRELLAIFYYRSPEARARRIAKTVEAAAALGARTRSVSDASS